MESYSVFKVESDYKFFREINSFLSSFPDSNLNFTCVAERSGFFELVKPRMELFVLFDFDSFTYDEVTFYCSENKIKTKKFICNFEEFKKQVKEILE